MAEKGRFVKTTWKQLPLKMESTLRLRSLVVVACWLAECQEDWGWELDGSCCLKECHGAGSWMVQIAKLNFKREVNCNFLLVCFWLDRIDGEGGGGGGVVALGI